MEIPAAGIAVPAPSAGVVVSELEQLPNVPTMKSFSVAVVDVEERVSDPIDAKHSPERPRVERLMPASKNSPFSAPFWGVPLLSVNDHGIVIVLGLTSPHPAVLFAAVA